MYNNLGSRIKSKVKKLGNKIYDNRYEVLLGLGVMGALGLGNKLGAFDPSDQIIQHMNPLLDLPPIRPMSGSVDPNPIDSIPARVTYDWNPLAGNIFNPMPVMNSDQRNRN